MMITRIWHGRTKKEDADIYRNYVIETGVPEYQGTEGNLDVQILQRDEENITHIWTVTQWQNLECIKSFAGNNIEEAKYYPEDEKYLLEFEPHVIHCRTLSFTNSRIINYIRQFVQLFEGGSWNGESYIEKLKTVDEQTAFKQPVPGKHSIAEILWHCTYWTTVILKRLQGDSEFGEKTEKDQNFLSLELLCQKGWLNLLAEFKQSQGVLINFLKTKTDDFLENEYKPGKKFDYELEGIIHHDIYHLGQIGLLISLLKNKPDIKPNRFADLNEKMFII